eukprot:651445-Amphidinium_carterae.2
MFQFVLHWCRVVSAGAKCKNLPYCMLAFAQRRLAFDCEEPSTIWVKLTSTSSSTAMRLHCQMHIRQSVWEQHVKMPPTSKEIQTN